MQMQTQENAVQVSTTKGIDVGKIEKELAAMWKPADEAKGAESGVTRACALNLLVYATVTDDRVGIDSTCFDHPYQDLSRLAQIIRERPQLMSVSDLNWGRLTAWRTLIASFWDIPDYKSHLDKIDRITIEYDPPDIAPDEIAPTALLILGWLASRLGWNLEGRGEEQSGATFQLRAGERVINIEMRATEYEGCGDGMLAALTISAEDSSAGFHVALSDDRKNIVTEARIDGSRTVGRVLS